MSREQARQGLEQALINIKPLLNGVPLELPNHNELDPTQQTGLFIKSRIVFDDAWQASIGTKTPHLRVVGMLQFDFNYSVGAGTSFVNEAMTVLYRNLHMRDDIPGVRTMAVKFGPMIDKKNGWLMEPMAIPFWYDDLEH